MPDSQATANSFMTGGRADQTPEPWSQEVDVCYIQGMGQLGPFHASGSSNVVPKDVNYNPINEEALFVPPWKEAKLKAMQNDNDADDAKK